MTQLHGSSMCALKSFPEKLIWHSVLCWSLVIEVAKLQCQMSWHLKQANMVISSWFRCFLLCSVLVKQLNFVTEFWIVWDHYAVPMLFYNFFFPSSSSTSQHIHHLAELMLCIFHLYIFSSGSFSCSKTTSQSFNVFLVRIFQLQNWILMRVVRSGTHTTLFFL